MPANRITLWDPLIRLFHGSLVAIVIANYFVNEKGEDWHQWLGYTALAWLVLRFVWGFVGPRPARWGDFFPTPSRLMAHVRALLRGEPYHRLGHSPLGALVMILMMLCILALGITGWLMAETDLLYAADWQEDLHGWIADTLMGLAAFHVFAALFESVRLRENLPLSMITGKRRLRD